MQLTVTTVERRVLDLADVSQITMPTKEGQITVLSGHEPIMAALAMGELIIESPGSSQILFIDGGIAQIDRTKVEILTRLAESAEELDEAKIEEAKRSAEQLLKDRPIDVDLAKIEVSLQRELTKMKMLKKWKEQKH